MDEARLKQVGAAARLPAVLVAQVIALGVRLWWNVVVEWGGLDDSALSSSCGIERKKAHMSCVTANRFYCRYYCS